MELPFAVLVPKALFFASLVQQYSQFLDVWNIGSTPWKAKKANSRCPHLPSPSLLKIKKKYIKKKKMIYAIQSDNYANL